MKKEPNKDKKEKVHLPPQLARELRAYSRIIDILSKVTPERRSVIVRAVQILL